MSRKTYRFLTYAVALAAGLSSLPGLANAAPAESASAVVENATAGAAQPAGAMEEKGAQEQNDQAIREAIQKYEGKTLVGVDFEGGSEQTRATALLPKLNRLFKKRN